jgi:D-threo-aldose 1-dehydrogenase
MECCEKHGIRVHIAGTMGGEQYSIFRPTAENKPRVDAWEALAEKHSVSLPAVAIRFAFLPSCVEKVIMGMSTPDEVSLNMASLEEAQQVPAAMWADAKAAGLIPAGLAL